MAINIVSASYAPVCLYIYIYIYSLYSIVCHLHTNIHLYMYTSTHTYTQYNIYCTTLYFSHSYQLAQLPPQITTSLHLRLSPAHGVMHAMHTSGK